MMKILLSAIALLLFSFPSVSIADETGIHLSCTHQTAHNLTTGEVEKGTLPPVSWTIFPDSKTIGDEGVFLSYKESGNKIHWVGRMKNSPFRWEWELNRVTGVFSGTFWSNYPNFEKEGIFPTLKQVYLCEKAERMF